MGRLLHTFGTTITASQSMKLFTARKEPKRSWPEHFLYLVAVCDACGGGAEVQVLDNIVHYASSELSTVLMARYNKGRYNHLRQAKGLAHFAQTVEIENKTERTLGSDVVAAVADIEATEETRTCFKCGKKGHMKVDCRSKKKAKENDDDGSIDDEVILAVQHSSSNVRNNWIFDSGSSRHLFNDERLMLNAKECSDEVALADDDKLVLTKSAMCGSLSSLTARRALNCSQTFTLRRGSLATT